MYAKCKQLIDALTPKSAETLADLFYEIGKDSLKKNNHEVAIRWLERAYDTLGKQDMELLSPEAGELRLSTMHSISMHSVILAAERTDTICSPDASEDQHDGTAGQSMADGEAYGGCKRSHRDVARTPDLQNLGLLQQNGGSTA
jgi:hypothetical protein